MEVLGPLPMASNKSKKNKEEFGSIKVDKTILKISKLEVFCYLKINYKKMQ